MKPRIHPLYPMLILGFLLGGGTRLVEAQTITTIAGTGTAGASGDNGPASSAQLRLPTRVCADTSGVLYIADTGSHRIRKIGLNDTITTVAGTADTPGSSDGLLDSPSGIAVGDDGTLYIADTDNHRICKLSGSTLTAIAGTGRAGYFDTTAADSARFKFPSDVAVDSSGNVYVADTGNHCIRKITEDGVTTIAGTGTAGFSGDDGPARLAQLDSPSGVFVDDEGNVYIADTNNHRIRRISASDSTISTVAGSGEMGYAGDGGPATSARLSFPSDAFVSDDGTLYIADRFNHRIRRVAPDGVITTLAGNGDFGFSGDGAASNVARLASPSGIFVDDDGNAYVADTGNYRIRKIQADEVIGLSDSTLSGNGRAGPSREVRILGVSFTGDGETSVESLTFTLSDLSDSLATGLSASDFSGFFLYESDDDTLDAGDARIGALDSSQVALGTPLTVQADSPPVPGHGIEKHYLLSARISRSAVQGHAFKVGFATGGLRTSKGGWGTRVAASDSHRVTIDAVATRLVFSTQPSGVLSGNPFLVQPVVEAVDDSGFVDLDFDRTVRLTTTGTGTLLHNEVTADSGVAAFTALTYLTTIDEESFVLTAQDAGGLLPDVDSKTLKASTVDDPPVVDFPSLVMDEDDPIGFRTLVSDIATDPDDEDLTLTFTSSHIRITVSGDSLIVLPEPDWHGIDTLTVTATDPFGLYHSDSGIIEVRSKNDPPVLSLPDSLSFSEDDTLGIDLERYVSDVDHGFDDLSWTFIPSPGLSVRFDEQNRKIRLWGSQDLSGSFSLVVQVRDPSFSADLDTVQVEILPVNDPPCLNVPDTVIVQGDSLTFDLKSAASDVDDDLDQLVWTAYSSAQSRIVISPSGEALVAPPPSFFGVDTLLFAATDPRGGAAQDTVLLTILRVDQPPVLSDLPDTTISQGTVLVWDLGPFASDPDDLPENLIWSASGSGLAQLSMSGSVLTFHAPPDTEMVEEIEISVFDLFGFSDSGTLRIAVRPPVISGVPDVDFEAGKVVELPLLPYLSSDALSIRVSPSTDSLQVQVDPATYLATFRALDGWKGEAEVAFVASGYRNRTDADTIQVSVSNPSPVLTGFSELFLDAGDSSELPLDEYVRDDEPLDRIEWTALPDSGLTVLIDSTSRTALVAASDSASGLLRVVFTATDAQGGSDSDTLRVTVRPVPSDTTAAPPDTSSAAPPDTSATEEEGPSAGQAPLIASIPPIEFHKGTYPRIELDQYVEDDGPSESLSWEGDVEPDSVLEIGISPEHVLTLQAIADTAQARIFLRVTDADGLSDTCTVQVIVHPPVPPFSGDFNLDGRVDLDDFFLFADALGLTVMHPAWDPVYDLNGDGMVGFDDFFLFVDVFEEYNRVR